MVRTVLLEARKRGRPRLIASPEEFEQKVAEYVERCKTTGLPLTWTGMALALGFSARKNLDRYQKYEEFSHLIKRAKLLVEHAYELRLHTASPEGAIYVLKKFGWTDGRSAKHHNTQPYRR